MNSVATSPLDPATREQIVDLLLAKLDDNYVFPDVAGQMADTVRDHLRDGAYDDVEAGDEFARRLTADLQAVSHDLHLRMRFSDDLLPPIETSDPYADPAFYAEYRREASIIRNNGFERLERLAGNVGYVLLTAFDDAQVMGETAAAAMTFVADTSALIIDIRGNGGGEPFAVALITTYLFGPNPVHLNSFYHRPSDRTNQSWTLPYVPGRRFGPDKPVYVLTSRRTFSAAEEFAYNLQQLGRATIVGQPTGGGAHPRDVFRLTPHFEVNIPTGRPINPVSSTNWEGAGVTPDIVVPAADALRVAHRHAIEQVLEAVRGDGRDPERALDAEARETLLRMDGPDAPGNEPWDRAKGDPQ